MEARLSALADGVLAAARDVGLAAGTVTYYGRCCAAVSRFCVEQGIEQYSRSAKDAFAREQDGRLAAGRFGPVWRSALEKAASMMLEFQEDGKIEWRRRRPRPAPLPPCFEDALRRFEAAERQALSPGSVELLAQGARRLMARLADRGHADFGRVGLDDVRAFLASAAPRHQSGMGNVVWTVKRLFAFLNGEGLSGLRVDAMLARPAPRRVRVLPPFTLDEVDRLLAAIDTGTGVGKRDYAMVRLAVSTGLRLGDITGLRLADVDWRRDEIRVVQHKTATPVALPLTADAGNAIADYVLSGRPASRAPEVFLRAYAPFTRLTGTTGALIMSRYLGKAGIDHQAGDGKTFHALRRTMGTRLVETGAGLPMAAQILGHARIDSSKRYIGLDVEALRECCLPLAGLECRTEALR